MSVRIASGSALRREKTFINPYNGDIIRNPKNKADVVTPGNNQEDSEGKETEEAKTTA